jgi:hypothetical protein
MLDFAITSDPDWLTGGRKTDDGKVVLVKSGVAVACSFTLQDDNFNQIKFLKMKKKLISYLFLMAFSPVFGQKTENSTIVGTYEDAIGNYKTTVLTLNSDNTFQLQTFDPVFMNNNRVSTTGKWVSNTATEVILNPDKQPRISTVTIDEKIGINNDDSLQFNINYFVEEFENEKFVKKEQREFERISLYINNKRNYYNLVTRKQVFFCFSAPPVRRQILVDKLGNFKISKKDLRQIGVETYGFDGIKWVSIQNKTTNNIAISIVQPFDKEKMPRSKKVIIKGKKAYYYEYNGKIDTSIFATMLKK